MYNMRNNGLTVGDFQMSRAFMLRYYGEELTTSRWNITQKHDNSRFRKRYNVIRLQK